MKRVLLSVFVLFSSAAFAAENRLAFIYYYAWYENEAYDGQWLHWEDYDHHPPRDVSSAYYPKLGAYSSNDPIIIDQHMRWIAGANINVVIFSWWGRNDSTNRIAKLVLDSAADYNLSVAFLIEPYGGRTTKSICADIEYLQETYGKHPAFFRLAHRTAYGPSSKKRPVFFIYQPEFPFHQLKILSETIHSGSFDSILLFQSTDASFIQRTHADGIFAYEAVQEILDLYSGISESVKRDGGIFIPCVSPGFNINKTFHTKSPFFQSRRYGLTYDQWWERVLVTNPEFVGIISFNEWHEGTQIEPAILKTDPVNRYLSYDGAFGRKGDTAQFGYLRRTARWINLLQQLP